MPDTGTWLTTEQVATRLQVTTETVRSWIKAGRLPAARFGRLYHIRPEDLDDRTTEQSRN